ncbi:MAG: hypothetical protein A4E71_00099 [Smithella sp. PtaU1.Bin162]|nr:MAG: hypothetical protein A4E71_00099 [Smithella sp. PtaU1.Bin162]
MGKGSSTTTSTTNNNYDPVSSAKMAEIAERQQDMADEQWQMYKDYFQEYEIETAKANKELLPYISDNAKAQLKIDTQSATEQAPILTEFNKQALEGVDVNERMDSASNEVKSAMKLGEATRRRDASRMGIDPNSTAYANSANQQALETAKGVAGSRTAAKTQAETENFQRLGVAAGKDTGQLTTVNNADPASRAAGLYSGAASTYAPLATRVLSSQSAVKTPSAGVWGFLGNMMGQGLGSFAGGAGSTMGSNWANK